MNQCVSLRHDLPWRLEWKSSGTWTDTTDGALLFSQYNSSSTANGCYLYRRSNNDFFALGTYSGGKYHNYGVSFANSGIDTTQEHIFRLENRISDDGSNMVYLFVDDAQVGPLNHYWVGGTDQKKTDDWVSGKDFTFSYLGTNPHTIGGCTLDYIQVWEDYHTHSYENGICTGCGAVQADIVIVTQPVPYDAAIGEKATLRVEALGEGLRYQWYYRDAGSLEFTKSTVRKSTYALTVKPTNVNRELYCVITDAKGN